ncbi:uncharacterized protein MONBRDRAFT_7812 [Monosiga brevicollis MX1]|uniref:Uncharacterized protein n=1 Tax=Monosiga brevicollis TaxID=81824 RepID=A9UXH4_MONBE|nr:uncharacterized protein MONBRDRAFT_7812 [Monosiga brevicollis MX1]EDQ90008.1 predicted protein [Monosiga brevicollis MX1]|eukprot:XP_001745430.1 hypothetical protein [Monosiga brevicollis MX1]
MGLNARWPAPVLGWAVLLLAAGMYQATAQQMTLDDLAKPIPMTPGDFDLLREAGTFPIVLAFDQKAADAAGSELEGLARVMLVDVQEPDHLAHLGLEAGQLPTYRVFGYKADASASGQDFEVSVLCCKTRPS